MRDKLLDLLFWLLIWVIAQGAMMGLIAKDELDTVREGKACPSAEISSLDAALAGAMMPLVFFAGDQARYLDYCRARGWK